MDNISKKGDAIIAIDEHGSAKLIMLLTTERWKEEAVREGSELENYDFEGNLAGLWYANMLPGGCGPGGHHYGCEGDCFYVEWELAEPLFLIDIKRKAELNFQS